MRSQSIFYHNPVHCVIITVCRARSVMSAGRGGGGRWKRRVSPEGLFVVRGPLISKSKRLCDLCDNARRGQVENYALAVTLTFFSEIQFAPRRPAPVVQKTICQSVVKARLLILGRQPVHERFTRASRRRR